MTPGGRPAALARGPEVRSIRASVRRAIAAGTIDVAALLHGDADESVETIALEMRIDQLVGAVTGVGDTTIRKVCADAGVDRDVRLHQLTIARRRALADAIRKEIP